MMTFLQTPVSDEESRSEWRDRYVPPRQVVAALVYRNCRLVDDVAHEERTSEKGEGVEQLVHLSERVSTQDMATGEALTIV